MDRSECRILTIDDEKELTDIVVALLQREQYSQVDVAGSCSEAKEKLRKQHYDLILLDVMLSDGNGFDFYAEMQETGDLYDVPVIFLSARDEDTARLKGLGLGADDYITKPFLPKELLLRIGAVLRRSYHFEEMGQSARLGQTLVSMDAGTVTRNGKETALTAKELALFHVLFRNRGKIVTTDTLCDALWPDGSFGLESSLIVHMRHLREKVEAEPSKPQYLITVRGLGYKLEKES